MSEADVVDVRRIDRDPQQLETLYRAHVSAVEGFVARRLTHPACVADVTSEVFLAAIASCRKFDPDRATNPRVWLFGIAYRLVAEHHRRSARRTRLQHEGAHLSVLESDSIERLEARIDAEREARDLRVQLERLSERDRALLELTSIDGLSIADAAVGLGLAHGTARVRLHRLKTKLRTSLRPAPPPVAEPTATLAHAR
ncbi:RNA polymerase sigma factor [Microbacterium sp. Leaf320]|uniref:RNA polymerase sigma factor n=1 Tax=Microbacterium sp. Leaf320 TaxID=1736334 RepID=UPI0006FA037F|nr:sigma-70 family RNA polymerase sigma factor [Microbacterium sp. Leaf320]KQQ65445.1 hypothetical protein ASF63_15555 [Microbacterium sp. Leaf320]